MKMPMVLEWEDVTLSYHLKLELPKSQQLLSLVQCTGAIRKEEKTKPKVIVTHSFCLLHIHPVKG